MKKAVGFINYNEIPFRLLDVRLLRPSKLVGADHDGILLKRIKVSAAYGFVKRSVLQQRRLKIKLVR